jgi:hypothetical protein
MAGEIQPLSGSKLSGIILPALGDVSQTQPKKKAFFKNKKKNRGYLVVGISIQAVNNNLAQGVSRVAMTRYLA